MREHTIILTAQQLTACGKDDAERAKSLIFVSNGSGGDKFRAFYSESKWSKMLPLLSRSIFSAFCDFVVSGIDAQTGGFPQLSCLYPTKCAQKIGFVEGTGRSLYGIELDGVGLEDGIRWVNSTFENCDPSNGQLRPGAQRQPPPA